MIKYTNFSLSLKLTFLFIVLTIFDSLIFAQMTPTYELNIPMRDAKSLAADVYIPSSCSSCPAILIQTPYNKNLFRLGLPMGFLQNLETSPYAWVVVDWRGFYGSSAAAIAQPMRGEDGYDVIDWIISQTWSDGKVGTWGPSALGGIQYSTAKENHPAHTCAAPLVAHPQQAYDGYFYGGVLEKSRLATLDALGYGLSTVVLANPYYNLTWQFSESSTWYPQDIHIPTLQIGGWYDHNINKMIDWYIATRTLADINVRDKQWLLIGPWVHGGTGAAYVGSPNQGELTYSDAAYESDVMALNFFAHYLLGSSNNWESTSKITYYELGKNSWNVSDNSSIENTGIGELFLNGNNLLSYNGTGSSSFISDPKNPSPTIGGPTLSLGLNQGPYDQASLESRQDVVIFSSEDLLEDYSVSGRVKLNLFVQCDQPDADIAVRVVDVYPDGRNMLINDGIKRMRFRNGYTQANESFMIAGQVYNVEVKLPFVNYTWEAGHKIKIYISGNSATRWDVNLQNGGTMYAAGDSNVAIINIHHSATYPSKIIFPGNDPILFVVKGKNENEINIFPNPAKEQLSISLSNNIQPESYKIINLYGQVLQNKEWISKTINISELPKGIYFLKLYSGGMITGSFKFIKE